MKSQQAIKGYKLTANTPVDILETFGAPVVLIQNQGTGSASVIMNEGEPLVIDGASFSFQPFVPLVGVIEANASDVIVFA